MVDKNDKGVVRPETKDMWDKETAAEAGKKGGRRRKELLTDKERKRIGQMGAAARWGKDLPKVICGSPDRPLQIGGAEIPCYVLEGDLRVLSQRQMILAMGMSYGGAGGGDADRLSKFAAGKSMTPHIPKKLLMRISHPVRFIAPKSGAMVYGYEATILADLCESVLKARREGTLRPNQTHIAEACEVLMAGFARVGIIALIDEVTGYQYRRARKGLEKYLDKYISKKLMPWQKTFPDEYYHQIFRLRGWDPNTKDGIKKRPSIVGKDTNDIVYSRLAPGVLEELQRVTPRSKKGNLKTKMFQRLTADIGHPQLRTHIAGLIMLMGAADSWTEFMGLLNRTRKTFEQSRQMVLELSPGAVGRNRDIKDEDDE